MQKNLHQGHREKLKNRFLLEGFDNFEEHNILEMMLFYVVPRKDTNELAHKLLDKFSSLSGVMEAPISELVKVDGVGHSVAVYIHMFLGVIRRYYESREVDFDIINDAELAGRYVMSSYIGMMQERVYLICLDSKKKVLSKTLICEGTINAVHINTRKILETAISNRAVSVIISHNHPSGTALPSKEDLATTLTIKRTLNAVGINLDDHIIVAEDDFVSLADGGLLDEKTVELYLKQCESTYNQK